MPKKKGKTPLQQAKAIVLPLTAIGKPRHGNRDDGLLHSIRTINTRITCLKLAAEWFMEQGIDRGLEDITQNDAVNYLSMRSEIVGQKQLNNDRKSLELALKTSLSSINSEIEMIQRTRAYTLEQVQEIRKHQNQKNSFATEIALSSGLRPHELLTLLPRSARRPSAHRKWRHDRFLGREGDIYTVKGKGGLIREVMIAHDISMRLEQLRLDVPRKVLDRKISYKQCYEVCGGQAWSQSFSSASNRALGWSNGAYGLRHMYAQSRTTEIQELGCSFEKSQLIVSQEMGHFRPEIMSFYYR